MRPVHELWQAAREQVLPYGCTAEQERELRRVFFIGALCLHQTQDGFAMLDDADRAQLDAAVRQELAVFRATVGTELEARV
jgi:hypothetical protein